MRHRILPSSVRLLAALVLLTTVMVAGCQKPEETGQLGSLGPSRTAVTTGIGGVA